MKGYKPKTLEQYKQQYGDFEGTKRFKAAQKRKLSFQLREVYTGPKVKCQICNKELKRISPTHLKKCSNITMAEYRAKFPDAPIMDDELKAMTGVTKEKMIRKYGEEEGTIRWNDYCAIQAETNTFEYKQLHYGWTREQFDEYNSSRATTLVNMIRRHGEENGTRMFEEYCEKQRYSTTLDYFVEEYGLEEGTKIFNNFDAARAFVGGQSGIEVECYGLLKQMLPEIVLSISVLGARCGPFDYGCHVKKKLIEFNGDFWHANPDIHDESFYNDVSEKTAKQIWQHDDEKISRAKGQGYDVYVIWENDFRKDPDGEVEKAVAWFNS